MGKFFLAMTMVFGCILCFVQRSDAQVPEVANSNMSGVAKVVYDQSGRPTIMYNPVRCAQMGEACAFFRAHEHAHIHLNHYGRGTSQVQAELEADAWAARNVPPSTLKAAQRWFSAGNSPHIHGTGLQRAARITGIETTGRVFRPVLSMFRALF